MANRPILASSCAMAATAAEARYRIDAKPQTPRTTSVVALDAGAMELVRDLAGQDWHAARFLGCADGAEGDAAEGDAAEGDAKGDYADLQLCTVDGSTVRLSDELAEADFVMMIATEGRGAAAASTIGDACTLRGIMTAGLIVDANGESGPALVALRPNARVLLVTDDEQDATELLAAVGA
jgi:hypothetical protein